MTCLLTIAGDMSSRSDAATKVPDSSPDQTLWVALKVDEVTQQQILDRITAAGYGHFEIEHGYCRSLDVSDPDGLRLKFTVDAPDLEEINCFQARTARQTLKDWNGGLRRSNNAWAHRKFVDVN